MTKTLVEKDHIEADLIKADLIKADLIKAGFINALQDIAKAKKDQGERPEFLCPVWPDRLNLARYAVELTAVHRNPGMKARALAFYFQTFAGDAGKKVILSQEQFEEGYNGLLKSKIGSNGNNPVVEWNVTQFGAAKVIASILENKGLGCGMEDSVIDDFQGGVVDEKKLESYFFTPEREVI